jgi:pimeloyl-ACP methyl ester carboxylesterase
MRRRTLIALGLGLAGASIGAGAVWRSFNHDLQSARARLENRSQVCETPLGAVEYATAGDGPPVLMIHGTGGGFDQGLAFAAPLTIRGWRVIAPSRFGYLRSSCPDDASPERQADAFAALLDQLSIERAPVLGGSAGALSAIAFAIRHPDRVSALLLIVPAAYAPDRPEPTPLSPLARAIMDYGLRSDFLYWLGLELARDDMIATLLATDPALVKAASAEERARVDAILWDMLPMSARAQGLAEDARRTFRPAQQALEEIRAPTLAISLADDRFDTLRAAQHIARTVTGARLLSYPSGGHVWVGRHHEMFASIDAFLKENAPV